MAQETKEPDEGHNLGQLLDEKSVELNFPLESLSPKVRKTDVPEPKDRTGNEVENGPEVDPDDPNLSATMAEAGADDRKQELGMRDEDEMRLDDEVETPESSG